jgi:addiction module HigA family antidote
VKRLRNIHPGEVLLQEFLIPLNLGTRALAHEIGVEPRRIAEITRGKRAISPNTAIRLATRFGNSAHFWLMLQADFNLEAARNTISRAKTPRKH